MWMVILVGRSATRHRLGRRAQTHPGFSPAVNIPYKRAADLGLLQPVEPGGGGVDGSMRLDPDQVYATKAGWVFHPVWRRAIADKWDADPNGVLVIDTQPESAAGKRASPATSPTPNDPAGCD